VLQPAGNTLGPNTFLGQSLSTSPTRIVPLDFRNGQLSRYIVNVQRQLPQQWLLEFGYAGSHGYNLTTDEELNAIPAQYLSSSPVRDQATIDFLAVLVPNPFAGGLLPTGFTGATVARSQLLRPFPQFNNVPTTARRHQPVRLGADQAREALQPRLLDHRHLHFSHFTEQVFRLNATDADFEKRLARDDVPHRVTTSILYELPFGHGKPSGRNASGWSTAHRRLERQRHRPVPERPSARLRRPQHLLQRRPERAEGEVHRRQRRAGVRHQRLLLPRRRGADQRRRRSREAARR
jgi:hypothetical protein